MMYTANSALDEQKISLILLLHFCNYSLGEGSVRAQTPDCSLTDWHQKLQGTGEKKVKAMVLSVVNKEPPLLLSVCTLDRVPNLRTFTTTLHAFIWSHTTEYIQYGNFFKTHSLLPASTAD